MPYFNAHGKRCYYSDTGGSGVPLIMLHSNTASSKMFDSIINLYSDKYRVICLDFIGHGRSERLAQFTPDMWRNEGIQASELIEHIGESAYIIGVGGGAIAGLNTALERPELVRAVIADSFQGEIPLPEIASNIFDTREKLKCDPETRAFYEFCHGEDWEHVIDCDTRAVEENYVFFGRFFSKPFWVLSRPALLTGCKNDKAYEPNFYKTTYDAMMKKSSSTQIKLFEGDGSSAAICNPEEFAKTAKAFFENY